MNLTAEKKDLCVLVDELVAHLAALGILCDLVPWLLVRPPRRVLIWSGPGLALPIKPFGLFDAEIIPYTTPGDCLHIPGNRDVWDPGHVLEAGATWIPVPCEMSAATSRSTPWSHQRCKRAAEVTMKPSRSHLQGRQFNTLSLPQSTLQNESWVKQLICSFLLTFFHLFISEPSS